MTTDRACLACGGELRRIQLAPQAYDVHGSQQAPRKYAEWDARRNWMGAVDAAGVLQHWMCGACGLVQLYAIPDDAATEPVPALAPTGVGDSSGQQR